MDNIPYWNIVGALMQSCIDIGCKILTVLFDILACMASYRVILWHIDSAQAYAAGNFYVFIIIAYFSTVDLTFCIILGKCVHASIINCMNVSAGILSVRQNPLLGVWHLMGILNLGNRQPSLFPQMSAKTSRILQIFFFCFGRAMFKQVQ